MNEEERKKKIDAINAEIERLKERENMIPFEVEQMEKTRAQLRARILDSTEKMQEKIREETPKTSADLVKQSKELIETAQQELRSITRNIKEKINEQLAIPDKIEALEAEKNRLMYP